jgi:hypothetical protein
MTSSINSSKLQIIKQTINTDNSPQLTNGRIRVSLDHPRILKASWTVETSDDLFSLHGINLDKELIEAISNEIKSKS